MSLVGTLAKVAVGIVIAKGVGSMIQNSKAGGVAPANPGSGTVFGGRKSPGGGLDDMMGDLLGGGRSTAPDAGGNAQSQGGGLGGLLEELARGSGMSGTAQDRAGGSFGQMPDPSGSGRSTPQTGGLDDLLGQLGGNAAGGAGGGSLGDLLGGLLGGLAGGAAGGATPQKADTSFGEILNQSLRNRGEPAARPTAAQDAAAGLMLRAMIQAAKSDGKIDEAEKAKLMDNLAGASPEEMRFVQGELAAPVDVEGLARQVPRGLEPQVYVMSVMAINLDNQAEARYLDALAQAMGLGREQVNQIHARLGVPAIYA